MPSFFTVDRAATVTGDNVTVSVDDQGATVQYDGLCYLNGAPIASQQELLRAWRSYAVMYAQDADRNDGVPGSEHAHFLARGRAMAHSMGVVALEVATSPAQAAEFLSTMLAGALHARLDARLDAQPDGELMAFGSDEMERCVGGLLDELRLAASVEWLPSA